MNTVMKRLLLFCLITTLLSCSDSDDDPYADSLCDEVTVIDNHRYKNSESQGFLIRSVQLTGDCLEVEIESGGCDGSAWEVELIDADRVAESNPGQRDLKILLKNLEECSAIVVKTFSFDLRPLQLQNNTVLLNLQQWEGQIRYQY